LVVQKISPIFHSFFCFGSFAESNFGGLFGKKLGSSAAPSSVFENWGGRTRRRRRQDGR
jgi:hypothetical protein